MQITEEWRPVVGVEGYTVSDRGRVRSYWKHNGRKPAVVGDTPRLKSQPIGSNGYPYVSLRIGTDKVRTFTVHRLVLEAFIGPAPQGCEACHNDGDPTHNALENLRWDTHSANMVDKSLMGRHHNQRLTAADIPAIRQRLRAGEPLRSIAGDYGVSEHTISGINCGYSWAHVPAVDGIVTAKRDSRRVTPDDVRVIRRRLAAGETQRQVAADFGLAQTTISAINRRESWAHVA